MEDSDYRLIDRVAADVARLLLQQTPLDDLLLGIGRMATGSIPNCDEAGVSLEENGKVVTRSTTGARIEKVDSYQYSIGEGPCLDASRTRASVLIKDMGSDRRWPRFSEFASAEGVTSSYSIPMIQDLEVVGVLNLYSTYGKFDSKDEALGLLFAEEAASALRHAIALEKTRELIENLSRALETRSLIGTEIGLRMQRQGLTMEEAFESLKVESQQANVKLRDVAKRGIETFELGLHEVRVEKKAEVRHLDVMSSPTAGEQK